jgi:hypothetical protein
MGRRKPSDERAGVRAGWGGDLDAGGSLGRASMSAIAPGFADKPRRHWYARDDLGVEPFVVRTGVN